MIAFAPGSALANGTRLAVVSVEITAAVSLEKTEVMGSIHFSERRVAVGQKTYDLYLPVFVPLKDVRDEALLLKSRPALSVERRPVRLSRVTTPPGLPRAPAAPGQAVVWWRARLGKPRRGEKLIVDFRYEQKNFVREGYRGFVILPVAPDGDLAGRSRVRLSTARSDARLHLKSGKSAKPALGSLLKGRLAHPIAKNISCKPGHFQPIVVELVAR